MQGDGRAERRAQQANFLSERMCAQFRRLEKDICRARGEGEQLFKVNLEGNRVHDVGTGGRPTRASRRGTAPRPYVEVSDKSDKSDDEDSDLDLPLT